MKYGIICAEIFERAHGPLQTKCGIHLSASIYFYKFVFVKHATISLDYANNNDFISWQTDCIFK